MRVVCKYCKAKVEKADALQVPGEKYNTYYCNQECYDKANAEKKEKEIERLAKKQEKEENKQKRIDPVYEEIADIFGYRIANSALFKEMKLWRGICDDSKILAYLQEHKIYIKNKLEQLDSNEYSRIRYVSAILKNSLADYKRTVRVEPEKINVDCEIYEQSFSTRKKRRGLNALEDEVV